MSYLPDNLFSPQLFLIWCLICFLTFPSPKLCISFPKFSFFYICFILWIISFTPICDSLLFSLSISYVIILYSVSDTSSLHFGEVRVKYYLVLLSLTNIDFPWLFGDFFFFFLTNGNPENPSQRYFLIGHIYISFYQGPLSMTKVSFVWLPSGPQLIQISSLALFLFPNNKSGCRLVLHRPSGEMDIHRSCFQKKKKCHRLWKHMQWALTHWKLLRT